jgi:hypothetical protein
MAEKSQAPSEAQSDQGEESSPEYMTKEEFSRETNKIMTAYLRKFEKIVESKSQSVTPVAQVEEVAKASSVNPEVAELRKQLQIFQAKAKETEEKANDKALRAEVTENLLQFGIAPGLVKHAVGYLVDAEKAVKRDEEGNLIMKVDRVDFDIKTALSSWIKTDDAKPYRAPLGNQGSGSTSTKASASGNANKSKAPTKEEIGSSLLEMFESGDLF